ncbi:hypothetical protein ACFLTD_01355, partial [Elusimicrobiota bacterium]
DDFDFAGSVIDFKEQKTLYAQDDFVFIDMGRVDGLKEGRRMNIYRMGQYVVHPYSGEFIGNVVKKIGELQVTKDIEEDSATAIIVYCDREIEVGDLLLKK